MKYPENQFKNLVSYLDKVLNAYKLSANDVELDNVGLLNTLHFKCFVNVNYTDDNANVLKVDGNRLLPIDEDFMLYPKGCNDNHIETAIKNAIKQLQTK